MDVVAGLAAGGAQVLVGHPFDTAKVHLQNQRPWPGFRALYRGYRYPLVYACSYNAFVFPVVERTHERFGYVLSGLLAGACTTPLVFVFDLCAVKRQLQEPLRFVAHRGLTATLARESIAMALYFSSYQAFRRHEWSPMTAGAAAGLVNWTVTYPIDTVRNRQFALNMSIREAMRPKRFYRGFSLCAVRAVLVNAALFSTYEHIVGINTNDRGADQT